MTDARETLATLTIALLLVATFMAGGDSQQRGWGDVAAQLLALPILAWAIARWSRGPKPPLQRAAVAVAAAVFLLPAAQLLPIPEALWSLPEARRALGDDLAAMGVENVRHRWTLSPAATEHALWSMLPAAAAFLGALVLGPVARLRLLWLVIALAGFSLLLGLAQVGAPHAGFLALFPHWPGALNGVFANPNHQATVLGIGAVLCLALAVQARRGRQALAPAILVPAVAGIVMLLALPLTGSRAGLLVAMFAVVLAVLLLRPGAHSRAWRWLLPASIALAALGAWIAIGWIQVDIAGERRWLAAQATFRMGLEHLPLGIGVGSYVDWFEQHLPLALQGNEFFNHAHNEYAQWWLEAGLAAALLLAAVAAVLAAALRSLLARQAAGEPVAAAIGAWCAVALVLLHSVADYPLRTPALMAVTALLAAQAIMPAPAAPGPARRTRHE